MKKLNFLILIFLVLLSSCKNNNDVENIGKSNSGNTNAVQTGNINENVSNQKNPEKIGILENDDSSKISQNYDMNNLEVGAKIGNMTLVEKKVNENSFSFKLDGDIKIKGELSGFFDEMQGEDVIYFKPEKSDIFSFKTSSGEHKVELFYSKITNPQLIDEKEKKELFDGKKYKVELNIIEYVYVGWYESEEYYESAISSYKILD